MREKPEVHEGDDIMGSKTTHPSFGQVAVRRISGSGDNFLYGSDFSHHNWIEIVVSSSEQRRTHGRDWHFANSELVRVAMSEAQWATLLSSMNLGDGVPCTFRRLNGQGYPGIEPLGSKEDEFKREVGETLQKSTEELDGLIAMIESEETKMSKAKKAEILANIRRVKTTLTSDIPFAARQFGVHVETKIEEAKITIANFARDMTGREAPVQLGGASAPRAISGPEESE